MWILAVVPLGSYQWLFIVQNNARLGQISRIKKSCGAVVSNSNKIVPIRAKWNVKNFHVVRNDQFWQLLLLNVPDWASCVNRTAADDSWIDWIPVEARQRSRKLILRLINQSAYLCSLTVLDLINVKAIRRRGQQLWRNGLFNLLLNSPFQTSIS